MTTLLLSTPAADFPPLRALGRLHPLLLHYPIALITLAAAFEVFSAARRRGLSSLGAACIALGAPAAALTAYAGWLNAAYEFPGPDSDVLAAHRWTGIATAVTAGIAALSMLPALRGGRRSLHLYRFNLILSAMTLIAASHFGGIVTHGSAYLADAFRALLRIPHEEPAPSPDSTPPDFSGQTYARDARPIFAAHCFKCHAATRTKARLRLDSLEAALTGGKSGPVIIPGDSEGSILIHRVLGLGDDDPMPPEGPPLSGADISTLRAWIDAGAH